ncbi:MAG: hypothetical protein JSR93_06340 [Verrucomicrobia bacterium]|nr:hypothetical protein [Verrucomicrobiota bacterium]
MSLLQNYLAWTRDFFRRFLYAHRDSFLGNFAKAGAADFGSAKQGISEGDMADAVETKGGDAREGKNPKNELSCVYPLC